MKKQIINFFRYNFKWIFLFLYIFAALIVLKNHLVLFEILPIQNTIPFYTAFKTAIEISLLLVEVGGLVGVFILLYKPWIWLFRFRKGLVKIGLKNSIGEFPVLLSKRRDKDEEYGIIFKLKNVGLSLDDFERKSSQIEAALNINIYRIEYGRKSTRILIFAVSKKHAHPKMISIHDDFLVNIPNLLCVGATGAGKSYALATILAKMALYIPNVCITICDYKKSSFAQFADMPNFYGYSDVPDGIRAFYKEFTERLEANDEERNKRVRVLLIDEYGALISSQDKKIADELKTMISNMLFMARSLGMKIIVGTQRADSEHFKAGARDQFRAILAMGNLSKEQKSMLFTDYKEKLTETNGLGQGYLLIDGKGAERVQVAKINDFDKLNSHIRKAMYH